MRRLYAEFVQSGGLVFDIGAHVGNRTRAFASLGCRVVAVEPQPDFARVLRTLFARSALVEVVEAAATDAPGRTSLSISEGTPTVTTIAEAWREARALDPDFAGVRWNRQLDVETTTLDQLIARFGLPDFVKIDVEGAEALVLAGLTQAVTALSFEYLLSALEQLHTSMARLVTLGSYRFNWSAGESYRLASSRWLDADELLASLRSGEAGRQRSGDVYARLAGDCRPSSDSAARGIGSAGSGQSTRER
jgi:FkbM family methyltransferase